MALRDSEWHSYRVLRLIRWQAWHSLELFWREHDDSFAGWYVNVQEPLRHSPVGFDTDDLVLDVWVEPDGKWSWKDEDELDGVTKLGRFTTEEAARIRAEGERVIEERPWPTGWEDWKPDPEWPLPPELPAGWDGSSGDVVRFRYVRGGRVLDAPRHRRSRRQNGARALDRARSTGLAPPSTARTGAGARSGTWEPVETTWFGEGILMLRRPDTHHSVWHFWNGDGSFRGWYVNLEDWWRTDDGVDAYDHLLDIWAYPDGHWEWKDEDDLAESIDAGIFTAHEAEGSARRANACLATGPFRPAGRTGGPILPGQSRSRRRAGMLFSWTAAARSRTAIASTGAALPQATSQAHRYLRRLALAMSSRIPFNVELASTA